MSAEVLYEHIVWIIWDSARDANTPLQYPVYHYRHASNYPPCDNPESVFVDNEFRQRTLDEIRKDIKKEYADMVENAILELNMIESA